MIAGIRANVFRTVAHTPMTGRDWDVVGKSLGRNSQVAIFYEDSSEMSENLVVSGILFDEVNSSRIGSKGILGTAKLCVTYSSADCGEQGIPDRCRERRLFTELTSAWMNRRNQLSPYCDNAIVKLENSEEKSSTSLISHETTALAEAF